MFELFKKKKQTVNDVFGQVKLWNRESTIWTGLTHRRRKNMGLFSKPTYEELMLPFRFEQTEEDIEAGTVSIIAYGTVLGEPKSCYATYGMKKAVMYDNGDYEKILDLLKDTENKKVKVLFKIKNGKAKDFTIDLSSLASLYQDDRFLSLDLLAWGLNDQ